jgi:hypothetical protein
LTTEALEKVFSIDGVDFYGVALMILAPFKNIGNGAVIMAKVVGSNYCFDHKKLIKTLDNRNFLLFNN